MTTTLTKSACKPIDCSLVCRRGPVNRLSPVMSFSHADAKLVPDNGQTDRAQAWRLLLVPAVVTAILSRVIDGKGSVFGCSGSFCCLECPITGIAAAACKTQHRCLICAYMQALCWQATGPSGILLLRLLACGLPSMLANIWIFYLEWWSWQLHMQSLWQPHTASGQGQPAHSRCTTLCSMAKSPSQLWWVNGSATTKAWLRYSQRWSVLHILPCLLVLCTSISLHYTGVCSVACCPCSHCMQSATVSCFPGAATCIEQSVTMCWLMCSLHGGPGSS